MRKRTAHNGTDRLLTSMVDAFCN